MNGVVQKNPPVQVKEHFPRQMIHLVWMAVMKAKVLLAQYLDAQHQHHWEAPTRLDLNSNSDVVEQVG